MRIYRLLIILFAFATANVYAKHRFIENGGQWDDAVKFRTDIPGGKVYFESDRFTFDLYDAETTSRVFSAHSGNPNSMPVPEKLDCHAYQMIFKGVTDFPLHSKALRIYGEEAFETNYSFFIGNDPDKWAGNLKGYESIRYSEIYQGIDLKVYSNAVLKYDFIVKPGSSPRLIQVEYAGVKPKVNAKGQLEINSSVGDILESKPFAYQIVDGLITKVECRYSITDNILSFKLGEYNEELELIIDPELIFSTFSGSIADNFGYSATYDSEGYLYGGSSAFGTGYPVTTGAYQVGWAGGEGGGDLGGTDIAITKYSLDGSSLIYSTYLGGEKDELPHSLITNENNELYIFGTTGSSDFPTTTGAFQTNFAGGIEFEPQGVGIFYAQGSDIFVARLSANGVDLVSSTYLGGEDNDGINFNDNLKKNYADEMRGEIEIDNVGNIIIGSCTSSSDFPISSSAFQSVKDIAQEGVLIKLNASLSQLLASTFFGGNGNDAIYSIDVAESGHITVGGGTNSENLPTNSVSYQPNFGGGIADGFIATFTDNMETLNAMTYYGSAAYDQIYFVENDEFGSPHIYGQTEATGTTFIENAAFSNPNSGMLLSSFTSNLESRIWSTVFGDGQNVPNLSPTAFSVDICNRIYLSGWGGITNGFGGTNGLPITDDAIQETTDNSDFYFMVLEGDASAITFATFYGGAQSSEHVDGGTSRFDRSGKIYQAACAGCGSNDDWPSFPSDVFSPTNNSLNCNLGVAKIDFDLPLVLADFEAGNGCLPLPIQFSNTSALYTGSDPNYIWIFPNGDQLFDENPTYTFSTPGVKEVKLVVIDPNSCNITDTVVYTVEVFPELVLELTDSIISCLNSNFTITANTQGSANLFEWATDSNFTNLISQGAADSVLNYTAQDDITIYLKASNDACEKIDSIFISPLPILELNIGDTLLCSAQELTVSLTLSGNAAAASFEWSPENKIISGQNSQNAVFNASEALTISVSALSEFGCEPIGSIDIAVNPIFLETVNDTLACFDDPIILVANSNGLAESFIWSSENDLSPVLNPLGDSSITITPTAINYYYVQATSGGCSLLDSVAVSLLSAGTTASSDRFICAGDTATITVSNDFPGIVLTHNWQPEEFILSGQSTAVIRVLVNEPTSFTVLSLTPQGCEIENSTTIYISNLGNLEVSASANPINIINGQSSNLVALPANDQYNYIWSPSETLLNSNNRLTTASPSQTTTYVVNIIDSGEFGACVRSDTVTINVFEVVCGEPNIFVPNTFTPNGDGQNDEVLVRGGNITSMEFSIFNRWGELVFKTADQSRGWDGKYKGQIGEPAVYVYHLRARCDDNQNYFTKGNITLLR